MTFRTKPSAERGREMRIRTAFAIVLVSGIACLGVPSAAADELLPTPAATSEGDAPADETVATPTPEPSDTAMTEVTTPEAEEGDAPTDAPAPPTADEAAAAAQEATGEATEAADQPQPAEHSGDTQPVEEGAAPLASEATLSEETLAAAAEVVRIPRASVGEVNCTNLTVPVTLDNSASTEAVTYLVFSQPRTIVGPDFEEAVPVPAGAIRIVNAPVIEDSQADVRVYVTERPDHPLTLTDVMVDCTDDEIPFDPTARIGLNCAQMALNMTLDNSRSEVHVLFTVRWTDGSEADEGVEQVESFSVGAGDVQSTRIDVVENTNVGVSVLSFDVAQEWATELAAALFRVDCAPGEERVGIGEVNCTNLTVPVTLVNTRSPVETWFGISATGDFAAFREAFPVAAGAARVVPVPAHNHSEVRMRVQDDRDSSILALEIFEVDCERAPAGRAIPRVVVGAGVLAATGANVLTLLIAGLMLLASGGVLTLLGRRGQGMASQ